MKKTKATCSCGNDEYGLQTGNVKISDLHDFKGHPFKVEQNIQLFELMRSIEDKGVLVPLIVRSNPYGDGYEIIAGHRRKAACTWAGIEEVSVIVRELDDADAVIVMIDSNLQREHIKPSEKAYAYKMKLEAMKSQGQRTDLTSSQLGTKLIKDETLEGKKILRADERLAKEVGESRNQIARYIRLTNLIPKILDMVDAAKIAFTIGVELSYLTEEEQYELYAVMDLEQCTPSLSQANKMKRMSQSGTLDMDEMYSILEQEKPNQREQIKIRADTLADYFPKDFTPKQKVELIESWGTWHIDKVFSILGEDKRGRLFASGKRLLQIFWDRIQEFNSSTTLSEETVNDIINFSIYYAYNKVDSTYKLIQYISSYEQSGKMKEIKDRMLDSSQTMEDNLLRFVNQIGNCIPELNLPNDGWVEKLQAITNYIQNYLEKHNLLKYEDVNEITEQMTDSVNELKCMSKILKWIQKETNTDQNEKLRVEDYSQISTTIQCFENAFRNSEQNFDAEMEKQFTSLLIYLRDTPDIKVDDTEIEQLQNLITLLVKEIGRDSLFYRKILLQISLRNTTKVNVEEEMQPVE